MNSGMKSSQKDILDVMRPALLYPNAGYAIGYCWTCCVTKVADSLVSFLGAKHTAVLSYC